MKKEYLEFEKLWLSPFAIKSDETVGRVIPEKDCPLRTDFQRDRDRIIHCKSFRRLKHKTQVFLSPSGDHYRTRLTHTLEVTQIARTIARCLRLNEDLTEAIALGHDLGHTPFGHIGEKVLDEISGHFKHNEQSKRVVEKLENNGRGLNLTFEVRDGILNHKLSTTPATLEGRVVSYSDRIAYLNHDIDDAIEAGILAESELPLDVVSTLGNSKSDRIDTLVSDIVTNSLGKNEVKLSPDMQSAMDRLYKFMFERVYFSPVVSGEEEKARRLLTYIYEYYMKHVDEVPKTYRVNTDDPKIFVVDYIASMTDVYAIRLAEKLMIPDVWEG